MFRLGLGLSVIVGPLLEAAAFACAPQACTISLSQLVVLQSCRSEVSCSATVLPLKTLGPSSLAGFRNWVCEILGCPMKSRDLGSHLTLTCGVAPQT